MTVVNEAAAFRKGVLGLLAQKSTGTLAATTIPLFTIAGGAVAVTSLVGRVTVEISVANSYKLQHNPTLGTSKDLCTAADLGTTNTVAGEVLVAKIGTAIAVGAAAVGLPEILETGQIESVSAGTDGAILWVCTWVPVDDGATLVAA